MTQLEGTDEATALEQARARLEATLNGNEHWRALRQGAGDPGLEGHERALADNPLYKSWKVVNEGLESLRSASDPEPATSEQPDVGSDAPADDLTRIRGISADLASHLNALGVARYAQMAAWRAGDVRKVSEALGLGRAISRQNWIEQAALLVRRSQGLETEAPPHRAAEAAPSTPTTAAEPAPAQPQGPDPHDQVEERAIDLPDILERIRSDAASRGSEPLAVSIDAQDVQEEQTKEPVETDAGSPASSTDIEPPTAASAPGQRSPIPTVAASSHLNSDAAKRAKRLEDDRRRLSESAERGLGPDEPGEATVTFVIQEPAQLASQTIDGPAVRGEQRGPPPSETLSRLGPDQRAPAEAFVPPSNKAQEAEVVIVPAESAGSSGRRPGSVRRFLKALTGG